MFSKGCCIARFGLFPPLTAFFIEDIGFHLFCRIFRPSFERRGDQLRSDGAQLTSQHSEGRYDAYPHYQTTLPLGCH
jgi:hypothetical protein